MAVPSPVWANATISGLSIALGRCTPSEVAPPNGNSVKG